MLACFSGITRFLATAMGAAVSSTTGLVVFGLWGRFGLRSCCCGLYEGLLTERASGSGDWIVEEVKKEDVRSGGYRLYVSEREWRWVEYAEEAS